MAGSANISEKAKLLIEEATGHVFRDTARLERALTHASATHNTGTDYDRLEFLGDRVLGLIIAEMLFKAYPAAQEGELSVRLNSLVNAETCASVADEIGLHKFIRTGSDIKTLTDKRLLNVRADVIESLIATIYMDGGLEAARPFILRYWEPRSQHSTAALRDPKTELQEWAHQQGNGSHPVYTVENRTGPDHDPQFTVQVAIQGFAPAIGLGRSKRAAEQEAAEQILHREGVRPRRPESSK